jgi:hypothetical protein
MLLALASILALGAATIPCPGTYDGHVQGIAVDESYTIYWSFTAALVKSTREGALLKQVPAPSHHGDLCWHGGRLYVAVNLGAFNQEPGKADSWVYVYSPDLELLEKHPVSEAVHGAGGITFHEGRFIVAGGLPPGHEQNYLYLYDSAFRFQERREIPSGFTRMGIQTIAVHGGRIWCGTYDPSDALLELAPDFTLLRRHDINAAYGIAPWGEGLWLRAGSHKGRGRNAYSADATPEPLPEVTVIPAPPAAP